MINKTKIIKSISLSFFCFLLALSFWYLLNNLFLWREGSILPDLILAFISFSLFFIFSMIYLVLTYNRKIVIVSSFFIVFSFLVFFLRKNGDWVGKWTIVSYLVSSIILFVVYNLTNKNILQDIKNSIIFHPAKSILKAGPVLLIVFALLFSVLFYFNFPLMNEKGEIVIKEILIEKISRPFGQIINKFIPIYNLDMNVNEFIILNSVIGLPFIQGEEELGSPIKMEKPSREIINYLSNKGISYSEEFNFMEILREDEEFRILYMEELEKMVPKANPILMLKYRKNLSENWGVDISSSDRMGEVYTRLINSKIAQIPENIRDLILILPAIALFGVLEIAFLILNFIYSFIGWVLLIIFYKSKFYHYRKITVEKEEIEL